MFEISNEKEKTHFHQTIFRFHLVSFRKTNIHISSYSHIWYYTPKASAMKCTVEQRSSASSTLACGPLSSLHTCKSHIHLRLCSIIRTDLCDPKQHRTTRTTRNLHFQPMHMKHMKKTCTQASTHLKISALHSVWQNGMSVQYDIKTIRMDNPGLVSWQNDHGRWKKTCEAGVCAQCYAAFM